MTITTKILETQTIRDWQGCELDVKIEVPWLSETATCKMVLDPAQVKELVHLCPPKHLDVEPNVLDEPRWRYQYAQWQLDRDRAKQMISMISKDIANHLARIISEQPNTQ